MSKPLLVAVLHSDEDDPAYQIRCAAYGLEMQVDNEWNADLVLLAPSEFLNAIVRDTDVTGEDTAIVTAGIIDRTSLESSQFDYSPISGSQDNWILVGDPRIESTAESVNARIRDAISAKCRVIVCITDTTLPCIADYLDGLDSSSDAQLVLAAIPSSTDDTIYQDVCAFAATMRSRPRVILGGDVTLELATQTVSAGFDGILLMDNEYKGWGIILEILAAWDKITTGQDAG